MGYGEGAELSAGVLVGVSGIAIFVVGVAVIEAE